MTITCPSGTTALYLNVLESGIYCWPIPKRLLQTAAVIGTEVPFPLLAAVADLPDTDLRRQREVVDAFFAAARDGDFDALVAVLDPDVVLRSDGGVVRPGASQVVHGAEEVAASALTFARLSPFVRPALVNGAAGVVVAPHGRPFSVMGFTVRDGKIVEIDGIADPERLARLDLAGLDD